MDTRSSSLLAALLLLSLVARAGAQTDQVDFAALTDGVQTVGSPGMPGALALVSGDAFPVVLGVAGCNQTLREPLVAAVPYGRGRVVAFGHRGYTDATDAQTVRFMRNVIRWVSGQPAGEEASVRELHIGTFKLRPAALQSIVDGQDWWLERFEGPAQLDDLDVVVIHGGYLELDWMPEFQAWLRGGGGLVIVAAGWGWERARRGSNIVEEGPMNVLGTDLGIVWTNDIVHDTADDAFVVEPVDESLYNAVSLLETLLDRPEVITARAVDDGQQIEWTIQQAIRSTRVDDGPLAPMLERLKREAPPHEGRRPDGALSAKDIHLRLVRFLEFEERARERAEAPPAAELDRDQ
jgi:hypothetical protein